MKYVLFFFLMSCSCAHGQTVSDTVFFDKDWHKCSGDTFAFFRLVTEEKGTYHVRDYYKNGIVQMEGVCSSMDPETKNGFFTFYYESGQKKSIGEWYQNKKRGTFKYYSNTTGKLVAVTEYKNDLKNGRSIKFQNNGEQQIQIFENDKLIKTSSSGPLGKAMTAIETILNTNLDATPFNALIWKNLSDSARKDTCEVSVKFVIDEYGDPVDINPKPNNCRVLTEAVVKSITEQGKWGNSQKGDKAKMTYCTVSVRTPGPNITVNRSMDTSAKTASNQDRRMLNKQALDSESHAFQTYFRERFKQSKLAADNPEGRITVEFTIGKDGQMGYVEVTKSDNRKINAFMRKAMEKYADWQWKLDGLPATTVYVISAAFPSAWVTGFNKSRTVLR